MQKDWSQRWLARWAFIGFGLAALFTSFPGIDLWFAKLFIVDDGFLWAGTPTGHFFKEFINKLTNLLGMAVFLPLVASFWPVFANVLKPFRVGLIYLAVTLLAGPGLVVNALLKEFWGRARPQDVMELGGDHFFTPAFLVTDQCQTNCSFVSGDAAIAYSLFAFALLLPQPMRAPAARLALLFGFLIGLTRMAQGKHFLSDIVMPGVFVVLISLFFYQLIIERRYRLPQLKVPALPAFNR